MKKVHTRVRGSLCRALKIFTLLFIALGSSYMAQAQCTTTATWSYYNLGGDSAHFHATDTNTAAHHIWVWGDGTSSSAATSLNHHYMQAGTYHVCFYCYLPGTNCSDSLCQDVTVSLHTNTCYAGFTYSIVPNTDSVIFTNTSTSSDSVLSFSWSFGDGANASGPGAHHTYSTPGTYIACLFFGTVSGCQSSICDTMLIPAPNTCGHAAFRDSVAGSTIYLYSTSTGVSGSTNYSWRLDGATAVGANPNTAYVLQQVAPGQHRICLYIYHSTALCDSFCQYVTVPSAAPCNIRYGWNYTNLGGDSVSFNAEDTNSAAHHYWNFGDGTYSTVSTTHPTHVYAQPGTYHACFFVYIPNTTCVDSFCQTIVVNSPVNCPLTANWFSYRLGGDSIRFYTADTNTTAHHIWVWGDGTSTSGTTLTHAYPNYGTYHVCLFVYLPGTNCSDSMCQNITIAPPPCHITSSWYSYSLGGDSLRFYAADSNTAAHHIWVWGDGTSTSGVIHTTHNYAAPGTYHVCLFVYLPGTGCSDSLCQNVTIVGTTVPCNIRYGWNYSSTGGDSVTFIAEDTVSAAHHFWNFGDGHSSTASATHTSHVYAQPGTYHVCFYVYIPNSACSDSFCQTVTVLASNPCHVSAAWSSYPLGGDSIRFYATDTNHSAHHYWSFGDGTTSTANTTDPLHVYAQAGTYHVCYYVYIPGTNCFDSLCSTVTVGNANHNTCHITAAWTSYAIGGDSLRFYAADTNTTAHHIWSFGDGTYAYGTTATNHLYHNAGTYHVCLFVYLPHTNCIDSFCNTVTITQATPPCTITAAWHSYGAGGDSVRFYAADTNTAAHHIWVWGDGTTTSGTSHTTHVYAGAGTYHVCLYVYIPGSLCSDSLCDNITVAGNPCHITSAWYAYSTGGDSVHFYATDTNTAAHHVWVWGDGSYTAGSVRTIHHYADSGVYHVCLFVYLPGTNCVDSTCDDITVSATGRFQLSAYWLSNHLGGDTIGFTAIDTSNTAYQVWNFGDGTIAFNTTNPTHIYATSGVYTVCFYTFIPGTDFSDTVCQNVDVVLGINNVSAADVKIIAQPNPFNQSVQIRAIGLDGTFDLKLYDVVGRMLRNEKAINGSITLQRDNLSSGMYLYEVIANGKVISTGKLIAQ